MVKCLEPLPKFLYDRYVKRQQEEIGMTPFGVPFLDWEELTTEQKDLYRNVAKDAQDFYEGAEK